MLFNKVLHMLTDNRMPYYLPLIYRRNRNIFKAQPISPGDKIQFSLTFDVENDFGMSGIDGASVSVKPFLKKIIKILSDFQASSTFFVQGSLVGKYRDNFLTVIEQGHEIGLHGFGHEPWGYDWFINEKVASLDDREEAIKRGLAEFEKFGLPRPRLFRAPYMTIDDSSLELLKKYDFKIDSSFPSYKGVSPILSNTKGMIEMPVTANPAPEIRFNGIIPTSFFEVFNMKNMMNKDKELILKYVKQIFIAQKFYGQSSFLVFLAHPWEFSNISNAPRDCDYGTDENYSMLRKLLETLSDSFAVEFVTLSKLVNGFT